MTRLKLVLALAAAALLFPGCMQLTGPGGEGNGSETVACGTITDGSGEPVSGAHISLLPVRYNPAAPKDLPESWRTTTDEGGGYRISNVSAGIYNIEASSGRLGLRCLIQNIEVPDQPRKVDVGTVPLRRTGAIKVLLPQNTPSTGQFAYIPGSTRLGRIANGAALIDSVPAGDVASVWYYDSSDTNLSHIIKSGVTVYSGATAAIADYTPWKCTRTLALNTTASGAGVYGNVTGFPVLVRLSSDNFVFSQAMKNGDDLRFSKSDGTPLPHEIESWDSANGRAAIWVRADTVRGNNGAQHIVMHWGNPEAGAQSNPAAVFDRAAGFAGVWHLGHTAAGIAADATANGFNGTATATTTVLGMAGMAQQFDGTSSLIRANGPASSALNFPETGSYTVSAWVNADKIDSLYRGIVYKSNFQYGLQIRPESKWEFFTFVEGTGWEGSRTPVTLNSWRFLTGVRRGEQQYLYVDGVCVDSAKTVTTSNLSRGNSSPLEIGHCPDGGLEPDRYFSGCIDEVRIANKPHSADWIKLCYMNQKAQDALVQW